MAEVSRDPRIEDLLRELAPEVLGAVLRRYRDFGAAEDAVQEALLAAAVGGPRDGLPNHPRGWLVQVAFRRWTDEVRSGQARRRREEVVAGELEREAVEVFEESGGGDDALLLLFMCCHSALTPTSAIAL